MKTLHADPRLFLVMGSLLLAGAARGQESPLRTGRPARLSAEQQAAELQEATELMQKFARETSEQRLMQMTRELIAPREICDKVFAPEVAARLATEQAAQFDNAIADATRLIDAGIPAYEIRADAQLGRAELLRAKGAEEKAAINDMGGALRDYSSLIEDGTRSGQTAQYAHDKRGQVLMNLRAYDLAIAEYDRSLAIEDHA
jgi:tetratricopeptide (TPR) repeat protein